MGAHDWYVKETADLSKELCDIKRDFTLHFSIPLKKNNIYIKTIEFVLAIVHLSIPRHLLLHTASLFSQQLKLK